MPDLEDRDIDGQIDEASDVEADASLRPSVAEECHVSIEVAQVDGEDFGELFAHGEPVAGGEEPKVVLAHLTPSKLVMFPRVSASYRRNFLGPKYRLIEKIRIPGPWEVPENIDGFDALLGELPVGFSRHASRGLGLRWEDRLIIEAIENETQAKELVFVDGDAVSLDGEVFTLGFARFDRARRAMYQIARRSQGSSLRDRRILAHNEIVHPVDEALFPKKFRQPRAGEVFELVTLSTREANRSSRDRSAVADLARRDASELVREDPAALLELRSEIERVTLGEVIEKFETLLARNSDEATWQEFFASRPFVLGIAFAHPVTLVGEQAYVGGRMIGRRGGSVADFLFRQRLTGAVVIVEIKSGKTKLLSNSEFRTGLYGPHKELCEAMAQVLDQRSELTINFHALSRSEGLEDTHVGHVHCLVVAGRNPDTATKRRSLDLYRNSSKDVAVVTFDELLEKLRAIHLLMSSGNDGATVTEATAASGPGERPATKKSRRG